MCFSDLLDQIVLERVAGAKNFQTLESEAEVLDARTWNRILKFEYRLHSPAYGIVRRYWCES